MSPKHTGGFTLLELLVALAVFALVSAMAYSGLHTVLQNKQVTEQRAERIAHLQSAVLMLERELSQIAFLRGIRDDYGDRQDSLRTAGFGSILLEFTRSGWRNPTRMARSTLQRVAYGIKEESLLRYSWTVLDRAQQSTPHEVVLLEGVRGMQLRYLDAGGKWHEQWPPVGQAQTNMMVFPRALEINLELEDLGEIRRLLSLPALSAVPRPVSGGGSAQSGGNP